MTGNNNHSRGRIGYACLPVSIPFRTSRSFILKNFSDQLFIDYTKSNLQDLLSILKWNVQNNIYMFRIGSDIIPFGSHPINTLAWWEIFKTDLVEIGDYVKENNIRVSMHPGQYTVLNSPNEETLERSIDDIEYHCRVLDALEVDYTHKLILHVGGEYGNKLAAMDRFIYNFKRLSLSAQKRLILENDDKLYTIKDVLEICNQLQIPAVLDNLHHALNPCDISWDEILTRVAATWKTSDGIIKFHYSDQDAIKRGGAHSKSVITSNFVSYWNSIQTVTADVMLEVKDKEISTLKCIYALEHDLSALQRSEQWDKYKYCVMEKNAIIYESINEMFHTNIPMAEIYTKIDDRLLMPFDEANFVFTAKQIFNYVQDMASEKEKSNFQLLLTNPVDNSSKIKSYLQRLCRKYDIEPINNSYYFLY